MKKSTIAILFKIGICIFAALGIFSCIYWYLVNIWIWEGILEIGVVSYIVVMFHVIAAIPCFFLLGIAWSVSNSFNDDTIFSAKTAKKLRIAWKIMLVDSCYYLFGNIILIALRINAIGMEYINLTKLFSSALANGLNSIILSIIGLFISLFLYILSVYISKAHCLKEENESIL